MAKGKRFTVPCQFLPSAFCLDFLVGCTDLLSQRTFRQYHWRCRVSRPGSGWDGVVPRRVAHTTGSGASAGLVLVVFVLRLCARAPLRVQVIASLREALVHALPSPARLTTLPARAACPVISWGTYPSDDGECTHLAVHFPLRCFQRFLLPDLATQPAGRPTTAPPAVRPIRSSRTKISSAQYTRRP